MSKAAELAALIGSQSSLSNRNLIINGAMQVAQRGTSYTQSSNSGNYHTVDRFSYRRTGTWSGVTEVALSQESSGAPSGFTHFLRYAPTGSDSSTPSDTSMYIDAKLEGNSVSSLALGTSAAKSFTLSFYVRSSVTGTFSVTVNDNGGVSGAKNVSEYTINSADTWERKEITFPGTSSGSFATNTDTGLTIYFIVSADASSSTYSTSTVNAWQTGSDSRWSTNQSEAVTATAGQTFDITGIQLEVGEQDTPFEHRSYSDELARCQRYYWQFTANNPLYAFQYTASFKYAIRPHPVQMRATPTVTSVYDGGAMTEYQIDNYHWKAYIASGTADSTAHFVTSLKVDAEL